MYARLLKSFNCNLVSRYSPILSALNLRSYFNKSTKHNSICIYKSNNHYEYGSNQNSYSNDYFKQPWYYVIAPVAVIKKNEKDKEEKDDNVGKKANNDVEKKKWKRSWFTGFYTYTQDDLDQIYDYLHSQNQTVFSYPSTITTSDEKAAFRKFIYRNNWKTQLFEKGGIKLKIIYKEVQIVKNNKGLQIKNSRANRERDDSTITILTKRIVPEPDLIGIWDRIHVQGGHSGYSATIKDIGQRFYIEKLCQFVSDYIQACEKCNAKNNNNKKRHRAPLTLQPTPKDPLSEWSIDLWKGNSPGMLGETHGLVCKCLVTRLTRICPVLSAKAAHVGKPLHEEITLRYGGSVRFHSDNGPDFDNSLDKFLSRVYKYRRSTITPGCPWQNPAEAAVKVVKSKYKILLQMICDKTSLTFNPKKWPAFWSEIHNEVEYMCNIHVHSVSNISPFQFAYNKKIFHGFTPTDIEMDNIEHNNSNNSNNKKNESTGAIPVLSPADLVDGYLERMRAVSIIARNRIDHRRTQYKTSWDKKYADEKLNIGTKVKWRERNHWLPEQGCVYIHAYTKAGKVQLFDNMHSLVITVPFSEVQEALKHETLITYNPSKFDSIRKPKSNHRKSDEQKKNEINTIMSGFRDISVEISDNNTNKKENKVRNITQADEETSNNVLSNIINTHGLKRAKTSRTSARITKNKYVSKRNKSKQKHLGK